MRALRENCVVLDTSILPKRPCISEIKKFLDNELRLDMSQVKCIQPHNVKNVVYLGMQTNEAARRIASAHHLKHFMECEGKKIPIPIYVESSAIDVRLHDLPDDMDNVVIIDHMRQYGEVITIRNEVWKSYFPGFSNGVRVIKMKLTLPIPTFITVDGEITLVSYQNQVKTCRNCGHKSHPKQRCSEVAAAAANEDNTLSSNSNNNNIDKNHIDKNNNNNNNNAQDQQSNTANCKQWPSLPKPKPLADQQQNNKAEMKRQRSVDSDSTHNETKKLNASNSSEYESSSISVSSDICPYTQLPYKLPDVSHIEDPQERCAMIEDYKRRIDAVYSEKLLKEIRKKNAK